MATLYQINVPIQFTRMGGSPILVNNINPTGVDETALSILFGGFPGTDLAAAPYNFNPKVPLIMRLFCYNVHADGEFMVKLGRDDLALGAPDTFGRAEAHRLDTNSFNLTWSVSDWNMAGSRDVLMKLTPIKPALHVSLHCFCGLAADLLPSSF